MFLYFSHFQWLFWFFNFLKFQIYEFLNFRTFKSEWTFQNFDFLIFELSRGSSTFLTCDFRVFLDFQIFIDIFRLFYFQSLCPFFGNFCMRKLSWKVPVCNQGLPSALPRFLARRMSKPIGPAGSSNDQQWSGTIWVYEWRPHVSIKGHNQLLKIHGREMLLLPAQQADQDIGQGTVGYRIRPAVWLQILASCQFRFWKSLLYFSIHRNIDRTSAELFGCSLERSLSFSSLSSYYIGNIDIRLPIFLKILSSSLDHRVPHAWHYATAQWGHHWWKTLLCHRGLLAAAPGEQSRGSLTRLRTIQHESDMK